jgi:methylated-DNA-[protein]-cysteine S-methyltransferase
MNSLSVQTPIGRIWVSVEEGQVTCVTLDKKLLPREIDNCKAGDLKVLKEACFAISEYFKGRFDSINKLPLVPRGTDFQKKVWQALKKIPSGQTMTYGEIARKIKSPNSARAVGAACGANPILLAIPCHRVVGVNGSMTGFNFGIKRKKFLLQLEA